MQAVFDIVKSEGFDLTNRGSTWRGLCPLHDRDGRNHSFACGEDWWKCYSCGAYGDGPDFIMQLRGMTFPGALAYLGEDRARPSREDKAKRSRERKKREAAEWRERELARTLGIAIRRCHESLKGITPDTLDAHALILQQLSVLEYQHDILICGDPAARAELVRDLAGIHLFKRTLLFKKNFDYRQWLRATLQKPEPPAVKGVTENETKRVRIHIERLQEGVS